MDDSDPLNGAIDPACLQEPPLAIDVIKQLDAFELCLYSILTFMSCASLLLYLRLCVFIYRKLPHPKKTTMIWVNGAAPVIATMSCLGMWIPRATMLTDMTSNSYFAVVVYKIVVLLIEEMGGSNAFLTRFSGKPIRISTGPCCCCCPCLPHVPLSRRMFFWMKIGTLQYAILKTVFSIISVILWTNGNFHPSNLKSNSAAVYINPFVGVLTIISLWPVAIIFMNFNSFLQSINMVPKYSLYQLVLVLSQLQASIINILSMDGTIGCAPPFSSRARGSMLSQQLMIMEMFIITIFNYSLYHRRYEPISFEEQDNEKNTNTDLQTSVVEHDV